MRNETNQASILIVEDNDINRIVVEALLRKYFKIESVINGIDALKAVEEKYFDIILMDIHLGDGELDGIEVMKIIRKNSKYNFIKIFAVTAYFDDKQWFLDQGFDDMYIKPVIKEEMLEAINNIFSEKNKAEELSKIQNISENN